jgi:DNA-binding GntR family transcriptional regulator
MAPRDNSIVTQQTQVPLDNKVEPVSLVNIIVERFRQSIANGTFKPGENVNEVQLAEKMGVSRNTLREAIRILIGEGLLEKLPNYSSRVRILSPGKAGEILTLRAELEGFAARLLSQKLTPEKIDRLQKIWENLFEAAQANNQSSFSHWDFMLHQTIVEMSEHGLLCEAWLKIGAWIQLMFVSEIHTEEEMITNAINHKSIIDAILSGDEHKAEETIKKDLLDQPELLRSLKFTREKSSDQPG